MDKNLETLLETLEPEIEKKCFKLQEERKEKILQRLFILASILLLFIPSILIILDINVLGFIAIGIMFIPINVIIIISLALKEKAGGECY